LSIYINQQPATSNQQPATSNPMTKLSQGNKTAILFGATGAVGGQCLEQLALSPSYSSVISFGRKPLEVESEKLTHYIIDFEQLERYAHAIAGDDLYYCIGTTRAKAGSKEAFRKVDFDYGKQIAEMAFSNKVNQFLLVSAVGADKDSFFFYNQVKGELEEVLKEIPFWGTHIFRPSLLLAERNENRWGEEMASMISKRVDMITGNLLSKYRPIEADVVAKAMIMAAQQLNPGLHIYPNHYLHRLGRRIDEV